MILHINLMEQRMHLSRMDLRQKRPREEEAEQPNSAASRPRVAEMFKPGEELVNECSSYPGPSVAQHDSSSDHTASLRDESDTAGNLVNYEHALGQLSSLGGGFGHRGGSSRWYSSESAAQIPDYSPKLKRPEGDGLEERRSLSNLFARPRDESDVHMNISARTLRPSGGKDRHSKVFTAKGPRDRRVRLSVSTAIQFYDVQDRLGYDQPSKAVEWLMKKAKNAIDELSQIPLPGLDRFHQHHNAFGYSLASTSAESVDALAQQQEQQPSWSPVMLRGLASNSEEAAVDLKCHQQQQMNESDRLELVRRASEQQHNIIGGSALGDPSRDFPCRGRSQQQEQQQQQQQPQQLPFSLQSPNSNHQREWRSLLHSFPGGGGNAAAAAFHHHQHPSQQQQQDERTQHLHVRAEERSIPAAAPGFFQAPLSLPSTTTTTTTPSLQYHHHHHHHQQTSLVTVQQTYLQPGLQQLEFVAARPPSFAFQAPGLAPTSSFTHHVKDARSKTLPSAAGVDTTPQVAGPPRLLLNTFNNSNNNQLSAGDATTSLHFSGQEQEDQASSGSSSRPRKLGPS